VRNSNQHEIGNLTAVVAARYVAYYWGGAMVGRFIGSAILQKVRTGTVLGIAALAAALLVGISVTIADRIGIHHDFILPIICYLYIVYYAFKGSKPVLAS
jgi:fucose permease